MSTRQKLQKIDVLTCVGTQDVNLNFVECIQSCAEYFPYLSHLYIVTPVKSLVQDLVQDKVRTLTNIKNIIILEDQEVLDPSLHQESGWYKQQVIKLESFNFLQTRYIVCLSSDTFLLEKIQWDDLFSPNGDPILYYRKYEQPSPHYEYESARLNAIEKILQVRLEKTKQWVDFILDFSLWDTHVLKLLNQYLTRLYGVQPYKRISPGTCNMLEDKKKFGEWSLYAAFCLDILQGRGVHMKGFDESYFFQIHNQNDLKRFTGQAKIVHYVPKDYLISLDLLRT